ncbi:MAG: hypothetical protein HC819_04020 [Cyclobacteriaceae bacterium]|nr:hypothetical protein [Cyclobacteriaceae bacterium]
MKTVIEIPQSTMIMIEKKLQLLDSIYEAIQEFGLVKTQDYYTVNEFIKLAKIGRNKFEAIKCHLNIIRVSPRKQLIPHSELVRWFNGEIQ